MRRLSAEGGTHAFVPVLSDYKERGNPAELNSLSTKRPDLYRYFGIDRFGRQGCGAVVDRY
ncbi:MAG: hypothetical protein ACXWF8_06405 [Methylobacter sp.]